MSAGKVKPSHPKASDVGVVWDELIAKGARPGPQLEAYAGQVARLRDAQARLASEGLIIEDPRGNPIPHPAIAIEKAAQDEIRRWGSKFEGRR